MLDPTYPLFPIFAFLGFILALVPLPWHLQVWNSGTCAYMIWASTACLVEFINSIVWRDNAIVVAPVWCDITSKFLIGAGVGITASSLCISRRLYRITAIQTASISISDKRREIIVDLCIAVGIPILVMILHTVVQGHRFDILENIGCYPVIYNTIPAYFLVFMWPVLLGCVSFVYSALTLRAFWKRRIRFARLVSSNSSPDSNRYMRLMALAMIEMACTIPISIYSIYISNKGVPLSPWISWTDTHFHFWYIGQTPAVEWRSDPTAVMSVQLTVWLPVICALLFFLLFGFAAEAKKNYIVAFWFIAKYFGIFPPAAKVPEIRWKVIPKHNPNASVSSHPVFTSSRTTEIKPCPASTIPSSFCVATDANYDVENNAGWSSSAPAPATFVFSPTAPDNATAHHSLTVELDYSPRIYLSETFVSPTPIVPSDVDDNSGNEDYCSIPGPAAELVLPAESSSKHNPEYITPYHRPFTSPNIYPTALPFSSQRRVLYPIRVMVHTESHETL